MVTWKRSEVHWEMFVSHWNNVAPVAVGTLSYILQAAKLCCGYSAACFYMSLHYEMKRRGSLIDSYTPTLHLCQ